MPPRRYTPEDDQPLSPIKILVRGSFADIEALAVKARLWGFDYRLTNECAVLNIVDLYCWNVDNFGVALAFADAFGLSRHPRIKGFFELRTYEQKR